MAIDFPNSPSLNDEYTVDAKTWKWDGSAWRLAGGDAGISGSTALSVSDSAPSSPNEGDLWFDSTSAKTYVYYDSFWVEIGGEGAIGAQGVQGETGPQGEPGVAGPDPSYDTVQAVISMRVFN